MVLVSCGMFVVCCGKVILWLWCISGMFVVCCGMVIVDLRYGRGVVVVILWCGCVVFVECLWFGHSLVVVGLWCVCCVFVVCLWSGCLTVRTEVVGLATSKPLFANMLHRLFCKQRFRFRDSG